MLTEATGIQFITQMSVYIVSQAEDEEQEQMKSINWNSEEYHDKHA